MITRISAPAPEVTIDVNEIATVAFKTSISLPVISSRYNNVKVMTRPLKKELVSEFYHVDVKAGKRKIQRSRSKKTQMFSKWLSQLPLPISAERRWWRTEHWMLQWIRYATCTLKDTRTSQRNLVCWWVRNLKTKLTCCSQTLQMVRRLKKEIETLIMTLLTSKHDKFFSNCLWRD